MGEARKKLEREGRTKNKDKGREEEWRQRKGKGRKVKAWRRENESLEMKAERIFKACTEWQVKENFWKEALKIEVSLRGLD